LGVAAASVCVLRSMEPLFDFHKCAVCHVGFALDRGPEIRTV
jgi:hypothetical protein